MTTPHTDGSLDEIIDDFFKPTTTVDLETFRKALHKHTAAQVQQGQIEAILSWEKLDQMGKMLYLKEAADTIVNDVQGLVAEIEALQSKGEL